MKCKQTKGDFDVDSVEYCVKLCVDGLGGPLLILVCANLAD